MNEFTLPGLSRKRRALDPREALIPVATGTRTTTTAATHLTDDRNVEPTFDDLVAGNQREPSHADLLAMTDQPIEQPRPKRYPGVSFEAMAYLRAQDVAEQPAVERDEHVFDPDRLVPAGRLMALPLPAAAASAPPAPPTIQQVPTMPVGTPQILFDALDALDQLPLLYGTDGGSYQLATNAAAVLTRGALRPDLLALHQVRMALEPLAAELAEATKPTSELTDLAARLGKDWTRINRRLRIAELRACIARAELTKNAESEAPAAERALADMDATSDAIDAPYDALAETMSAADLRAIFGEPVEGRDYSVMPSRDTESEA